MATKVRTRNGIRTIPEAYPQPTGYTNMDTLTFSDAGTSAAMTGTADANGERPFSQAFWSERFAAEYTISGTVTFNVWTLRNALYTATLRARLYKITSSGNVETLIATGSTATTTTLSVNNVTATPTAVTVAAGERLILRLYAVPISGSFGSSSFSVFFGGSTVGSSGDTYVQLNENVTFQPNTTRFFLRQTTANSIGNFYDLLTTSGPSVKTAVVNTSAGGTLIQWTRTAGGTVLEFISPRVKHPGWLMEGTVSRYLSATAIGAKESNVAANCGLAMRLFRRTPTAVETQFYSRTHASELSATAVNYNMGSGTIDAAATFVEDDRLVVRFYIAPVGGTMAGGHTCTLSYDYPTIGVDGFSYIDLNSFPFLKAEGEPAGPGRTEGGLTTLGVGNG